VYSFATKGRTTSDSPTTSRANREHRHRHCIGSLQNRTPRALYEQNRFTVTRQLRYSRDETQRALDLVLFINGLPVFTFELKNRLTKQTVHDAIEQYRRDRNPREKLFELGRCVAHFAVDDNATGTSRRRARRWWS